MKKKIITLSLFLLFSVSFFNVIANARTIEYPSKSLSEGYYFWGYLKGDECMYLFYFGSTTEIDYSGKSVSVYFVRVVGESEDYVGFPTRICPQNEGEWFV